MIFFKKKKQMAEYHKLKEIADKKVVEAFNTIKEVTESAKTPEEVSQVMIRITSGDLKQLNDEATKANQDAEEFAKQFNLV